MPELMQRHCEACTPDTPVLPRPEAQRLHAQVPDWTLAPTSLTRSWRLHNFAQAFELAARIAMIAEREEHHPDLHLEGYRNLRVELSTHAVGGLTANDFILAAHIDAAAQDLLEAEAEARLAAVSLNMGRTKTRRTLPAQEAETAYR